MVSLTLFFSLSLGKMDSTLAGYALRSGEGYENIAVYDKSTGYFLTRDIECDGADIALTLTRDRSLVYELGYIVPGYRRQVDGTISADEDEGRHKLRLRKLRSLSTDDGITIGDNPNRVRAKLGKPRTIVHEGSRKQFLVFRYERSATNRDYPESYQDSYTFKAGKLIEISSAMVYNKDKSLRTCPSSEGFLSNLRREVVRIT